MKPRAMDTELVLKPKSDNMHWFIFKHKEIILFYNHTHVV